MLRGAPASSPKRARRAEVATFTAPIGGWISNRALAMPNADGMPQGADRLDNFFPTATGCILRRGSRTYVQLDSDDDIVSLFKYVVGDNSRMFGATDTAIYDLSASSVPFNLSGRTSSVLKNLVTDTGAHLIVRLSTNPSVYEYAIGGGDWVTVQFGVTGGTYLIGVNGASEAFIFDGQDFYPFGTSDVSKLSYDGGTVAFTSGQTVTGGTSGATAKIYKVVGSSATGELWLTDIVGTFQNNEALTDGSGGAAVANGTPVIAITGLTFQSPEGNGLTTADFSFVWVYKEALYFIEKNSLRAWYLEPDQVGGELKPYPLNGFLDKGGSLLWGQSWSLASSDQGGLSAQNVFTTTEGESAVFQGLSPEDATWSMVGVYRVGKPLGKHGFMRAGGDLVIATDVGYVPLSKAVQVDFSVLAPNAVSYPIQVAWSEAISERGRNWQCEIWPEGQMAIVVPSLSDSIDPVWFVSNANTGSWAPFTNWEATCVLAWNGRLFFGAKGGIVYEAMVGGTDDGELYTGIYVPLFSDVGKPTSYKTARMARLESKSAAPINEKVSCIFDFSTSIPSPPGASLVPVGNEWDNADWNSSIWNANRNAIVTKRRHSVAGDGYRLAPVLQITSGADVPLDAEIITLDVTFESGDAFT